jgi:hypothetical protein
VSTDIAIRNLPLWEEKGEKKVKFALSGMIVVVLHAIVNAIHGLAHLEIPITLSLVQSLFVVVVITIAPLVAIVLLWTQFCRIGGWLLLGSMAGSLLFGIYHHYIAISPDHVSQISFTGWELLFQITAILIVIVDSLGCLISVWILKALPYKENIL